MIFISHTVSENRGDVITKLKYQQNQEKIIIILLTIFVVFIATHSHAKDLSFVKKWELSGFSMPESVVTTAGHDWIYVSNVNANKNGYISRISKDGKVENYTWVSGLKTPAGLALYKDRLYVGDGTQLHIINVHQGKIVTSISSPEAKALNDVTISKNGQVFVSDIASGKIFTLCNDTLEVWFEAPETKHPNGLLFQDNHLFIANYATELSQTLSPDQYGSLYKVSLVDKSYSLVASSSKLGGLDGVTPLYNALLVSSNPTGELYAVTDEKRILVKTFVKGLADISIEEDILYTPLLFTNQVVAYHITGTNIFPATNQE